MKSTLPRRATSGKEGTCITKATAFRSPDRSGATGALGSLLSVARFANPFARARHDHAGETAKDYVELILEIEESGGTARTADLVKRLGVAQPTVTKSLDRLEREGLVTIEHRRGVQLTPEGQRMARESRAR
ncbi:MAG: hypothetical protein C4320_07560, partial [Armatimonadota bacterium]